MMKKSGEHHVPTKEEIEARCAQIQSEWTINERLSRGRGMQIPPSPSDYLHGPRRRNKQKKTQALDDQ